MPEATTAAPEEPAATAKETSEETNAALEEAGTDEGAATEEFTAEEAAALEEAAAAEQEAEQAVVESPPKAVKEAMAAAVPPPATAAPPAKPKKESFQWSTPADEFADDVGSDIEEDFEDGDYTVTSGDQSIVVTLKGEGVNDTPGRKPKKKVESKQKFPCPKCDKIWSWPWELRRHLLMHFKEKERQDACAYKCKECDKGFQWKRDLAQHMRLHTGEKLLVCSVCGKRFVTRQALLHHVVVHTGEKPFQCALCGNRFTQPANLRTHTKKKHGDGPIRGSKCPHCGETFSSVVAIHQHILEDHQNVVAEQREELALERLQKEQEKMEKERKRLENQKKREDAKRAKMDLHDFRDPNKAEWEINYEFQLGEGIVRGVDWDRTPSNGELNCDECEQKFGWRYEIMFHRLCHMVDENTGMAKNKVCPECDTVFKVPIGLKHHLLLHTGELPFLCLHCWRSFSSHIDLKLHIRREHLFHLDLPTPKPPAKKPKMVREERKVKKEEQLAQQLQQQAAAAPIQYATINGQQVQLTTMINELGEQVQVVVQPEDGQLMQITGAAAGDAAAMAQQPQQAIVVGPDGTIVNANNQDMIVVIQSDEYDQNQTGGLVVVDPSQLQQIVGHDGVPMTITQGPDGQATMIVSSEMTEAEAAAAAAAAAGQEEQQQQAVEAVGSDGTTAEMIVSDQQQVHPTTTTGEGGTTQYVSFEMSDDQQQQVVLSTNADGQQTANINGNSYVVVATEDGQDPDGKQTLMLQAPAAEGVEQHHQLQELKGGQSIIVQEMMAHPDEAAVTVAGIPENATVDANGQVIDEHGQVLGIVQESKTDEHGQVIGIVQEEEAAAGKAADEQGQVLGIVQESKTEVADILAAAAAAAAQDDDESAAAVAVAAGAEATNDAGGAVTEEAAQPEPVPTDATAAAAETEEQPTTTTS